MYAQVRGRLDVLGRTAAMAALVFGLTGCVLPPLEESADSETDDAGLASNGDVDRDAADRRASDVVRETGTRDAEGMERDADARADMVGFSEVSAIVTNHCLDCHGAEATNPLSLPGTPAAPPSESDLFDALVGVSSSDGAPYVKPGDPQGSVLYQRLALSADEPGSMPQGGWRADNFQTIDVTDGAEQAGERATRRVRAWIERGAPRDGN